MIAMAYYPRRFVLISHFHSLAGIACFVPKRAGEVVTEKKNGSLHKHKSLIKHVVFGQDPKFASTDWPEFNSVAV